jgi:hypothetical protein
MVHTYQHISYANPLGATSSWRVRKYVADSEWPAFSTEREKLSVILEYIRQQTVLSMA